MIKIQEIEFERDIVIRQMQYPTRSSLRVGEPVSVNSGGGVISSIEVDFKRGAALIRKEINGEPSPWKSSRGAAGVSGNVLIVGLPPGCVAVCNEEDVAEKPEKRAYRRKEAAETEDATE